MSVDVHFLPCLTLALSLALGACAARPVDPAPQAANAAAPLMQLGMQMDGRVPAVDAGAPLFSSGLSLAGLGQSLQYRAGYELRPGDAFTSATISPQSIGSRRLQQQLQLRLPSVYGAPLLLGAESQQQDSVLLNGEAQQLRQSADLQWSPAFAALHLSWTPEGASVDAAQALRCDVAGALRIPLSGDGTRRFFSLEAGARSCIVVNEALRPAAVNAQTWSAALRWGAAQRETSLRVLSVSADPAAVQREAEAGGYELRLAQQRQLGPWEARADLAWRHTPTAVETGAALSASPWAASAELSRRLAQTRLAASWKRGDPYWFLSDVQQAADRVALTLDLSPWAAASFSAARAPSLALSYEWSRLDTGSTLQADQSINWNLSFPWR